MTRVTYTHRGWFGLCPVFLGDVDSDTPNVDPRHRALEWLLDLSEAAYGACFALASALDPEFVPSWPLRITGQLAHPITREFKE